NALYIGYTVNTSPAPGAVAVWPSSVGHVGYVDAVNTDGTINTEEYNWKGDGAYHTRTKFNWSAAGVKFIHIKDLPGSGTRIGVILNGTLYVKDGALDAPWVAESGNATSVALAGTRIGVISNGTLYVKDGALDAPWVAESGNAIETALSAN